MWCAGIRAAGLYRPTFWKRRGTPSEIIPPIVKKVTKLRANIPAHGTRAAAFLAHERMATAHDVVVGSEVRVAPLLEWEPRKG